MDPPKTVVREVERRLDVVAPDPAVGEEAADLHEQDAPDAARKNATDAPSTGSASRSLSERIGGLPFGPSY